MNFSLRGWGFGLLLAWTATVAWGQPGEAELRGLAWLLAALLFEVAAVPLPGFGYFSAASAFYLAGSFQEHCGPGALAIVLLAAGVLRWLRNPREAPLENFFATSAGPLALCFSAAAGRRFLPPPEYAWQQGLLLVFCGLAFVSAERVAGYALARRRLRQKMPLWVRLRGSTNLLTLAALCAGFGLSQLPAQQWPFLLFTLPLLGATHRAAYDAVYRVQAVEAVEARQQAKEAQQALEEVSQEVAEVHEQLQWTRQERALAEELERDLAAAGSYQATGQALLSMARRVAPGRSAVLFRKTESGNFLPAVWRSPLSERLSNAELLRLSEPVVERAHRLGKASTSDNQEPDRLLDDAICLALPLGAYEVLYVGRQSRFERQELRRLMLVLKPARRWLKTRRQQAARQQALEKSQTEARELEHEKELLTVLLQSSRLLATHLETEELLEKARQFLDRELPGEAGAIIWREHRFLWGGVDEGELVEPHRRVLEGARPLIYGSDHPFTELSRFCSLAAAPLPHDDAIEGSIVLLGPEAGAFSDEAAGLLSAFGFQLALALTRARLHGEILNTRKELIESNKLKAVGQLAAGVAHELNTPLGVIRIVLETLEPEDLTERQAKRLRRGRNACARAQDIVDRLLVYSRQDAAQTSVFAARQIVDDTLAFLGAAIQNRGFELKLELASQSYLRANCQELQQILINLLLNAMDAVQECSQASRVIRVACYDEGPQVVVEVEDRGPGVDEQALPRLFEPFFTTKPVGRGTGLGLSISHEIAQRHDGELQVRSQPGQGACFALRLPACPSPDV